jgi:hypothetical protein
MVVMMVRSVTYPSDRCADGHLLSSVSAWGSSW